jgi:hypothetical protein
MERLIMNDTDEYVYGRECGPNEKVYTLATIRGIEGGGSVHYIQSVILDKNGDSILTLG